MEAQTDKLRVIVLDDTLDGGISVSDTLAVMARALAPVVEISPQSLLSAAEERECAEPTYVGRGLAVPHAWVSALRCAGVCVARSTAGVPWGNGAAQVVVLTAAPSEQPEWYLSMLSATIRWRLSYGSVDELQNASAAELRARMLSFLES